MYYVGSGEAIVVSHGRNAILVDGGSGSGRDKNDAGWNALSDPLKNLNLRAIVASHPHRDHTNFHHAISQLPKSQFGRGKAKYFDNATPAADSNWDRLKKWVLEKTGAPLTCNHCPSKGFQVFSYYQAAIGLDPNTNTQVNSVPMIQVVCDGCANVRFYVADWIMKS